MVYLYGDAFCCNGGGSGVVVMVSCYRRLVGWLGGSGYGGSVCSGGSSVFE